MMFWIKHIFLTIVLLALTAYILMADKFDFIDFSSFQTQSQQQTTSQPKPKSKTTIEVVEEPIAGDGGTFDITTSSAATGLSRFYGKVKKELLGNSNTIGDGYVIKLKPSIYSLDEQLQRRGYMVKPGSPKFTGEVTTRHFRKGKTIRDLLISASEQEGMELIWQLERDYIIKHYFKVDADLLSTLSTVAKALDSDFEKDVYAFYCYPQRAVIITHDFTDYVKANCRRAEVSEPETEQG